MTRTAPAPLLGVGDVPADEIPPADTTGAVRVAVPFREAIYLSDSSVTHLSYAVELGEGEVLDVELEPGHGAAPPLVDVFERVPPAEFRAVAHLRTGAAAFRFEAPAAGQYLLRFRVGPERSGSYRLSLGVPGELVFPVAGGGTELVRGRFGDPRDGGARDHEGVDIFAPRGTPVVAVQDAVVTRVESSRTGGRVIWCEDERRGLTYFYAHLDRQLVRKGARVSAGDTIGTVGNTGNARRSSPHLHFAAYLPGLVPVDPDELLGAASAEPLAPLPDSALAGLGNLARTRARAVLLRSLPDKEAPVVAELAEGTVVRLVGAVAEWRRVQLGDGAAGFLANWLLDPVAGTR